MTVPFARRARLLPACIITAAAAAAALGAPGAASAAANKEQCSGVAVGGQGAAIAIVAEGVWTSGFNTSTDKYACSGKQGNGGKPAVTYTGTSSGAGLRSFGAETKSETELKFGPTNAFISTGEAPNTTQQGEIIGKESTPTTGTLETLPVAQFALTVYVNLPSGCTATSTPASGRLVLTDAVLQEIYDGSIKTWGGITGGGDALSPSTCDSDAIIPVVRGEKAGTTNVLKKYLGLINGAALPTSSGEKTWSELSEGKLNTVWPTALTGIVKTTVEGDAAEAEKVAATPGSIGYSNLAELRVLNLFDGSGNGPGTAKFWVEIENGSKGSGKSLKLTYADPASNGDAGSVAAANCAKTAYTNGKSAFPPPSVTGTWNSVTTSVPGAPAEVKEADYPLCNFVYSLAFTKYSLFEARGATKGEAETVENYLAYVAEKKGGQALLSTNDYSPLPKEVDTEVLDGITTSPGIGF
jgi:ABC-type phosphate transport system substrate-binding protein